MFDGATKPDWVTGTSRAFPSDRYITGLGEAETVASATEKAYASVAKVFKANVSSEAREWESYLLVENRGKSRDERRLTLDHVTNVTTDKVLENVSVLDQWYDEPRRLHWVLAGLSRGAAETATLARLVELDQSIETQVAESRDARNPLTRLRLLKRATNALVIREAHNSDLRVLRLNGQGVAPRYRVAELTAELERLVAAVPIGLELSGDHREAIARALSEGLVREGLAVVGAGSGKGMTEGPPPVLALKGLVRIWPIDVRDPQFRFVRWCSDFVLVESATQRVVGAFARGDKVGHLSVPEATGKALRSIQLEFASEVSKNVAAYVYGDVEATSEPVSGACPREPDARTVPM
ncbi:hypothetical protein YTPLAS18_23490 [Nitrospira sp.]|nr:hypothetical protein YTPLAS18_23490 [Nitrospira sp.]